MKSRRVHFNGVGVPTVAHELSHTLFAVGCLRLAVLLGDLPAHGCHHIGQRTGGQLGRLDADGNGLPGHFISDDSLHLLYPLATVTRSGLSVLAAGGEPLLFLVQRRTVYDLLIRCHLLPDIQLGIWKGLLLAGAHGENRAAF